MPIAIAAGMLVVCPAVMLLLPTYRRWAWIPAGLYGGHFALKIGAGLAYPASEWFAFMALATGAYVACLVFLSCVGLAILARVAAGRSIPDHAAAFRFCAIRAALLPLVLLAASAESYTIVRSWTQVYAPAQVGPLAFGDLDENGRL